MIRFFPQCKKFDEVLYKIFQLDKQCHYFPGKYTFFDPRLGTTWEIAKCYRITPKKYNANDIDK